MQKQIYAKVLDLQVNADPYFQKRKEYKKEEEEEETDLY